MLLAEKLLLLSCREKGGFASENTLNYGLVGAILLDLSVMERIKIEKNRIYVIDEETTDDPLLDDVLHEIGRSRGPRKAVHWIQKFARPKKIRQPLLQRLSDQGLIRIEEQNFLSLIPYKRYFLKDHIIRDHLIKHMNEIVFNDMNKTDHKGYDEESFLLLSLVKATQLTNHLFNREDRRYATKRINELTKDQVMGKAVSDTINAMQIAIITAVIVATTTTHNSNSSN